jgi:tetraacyldisaccharide 4'-kinase
VRLKALFRLYRESLSRRLDKGVHFIVDVVYDRIHNNTAEIIGLFLNTLSILFSQLVQFRYFLYKHKLLKDKPLGCLVVVVGNLTVGGTGKTPVVEMLSRQLQQHGRKVAIISRGYKSKKESVFSKFVRYFTHTEKSPPKIVSDGAQVLLNSEIAGDEPFMLASNLPGVVVICDKDRVKAGYYAIKDYKCDTLVLDDGYQYLKLRGSLNICLIDTTNPFGNERLLPRGILREPLNRLSKADYILFTKTSSVAKCSELYDTVKKYNEHAKIIYSQHAPKYFKRVDKDEEEPLSMLNNLKVAVFSGIAYPESFEQTIEELGGIITYNKRFLDHHRFSKVEIEQVYQEAFESGAKILVTTEKDAVRLPSKKVRIPLYYLRLEIKILSGEENFKTLAERICLPLKSDML